MLPVSQATLIPEVITRHVTNERAIRLTVENNVLNPYFWRDFQKKAAFTKISEFYPHQVYSLI